MVRAARLLEVSAANPGLHPATGEVLTLSLGDALILAVTERLGVKVLTGDRYWSQLTEQGHTSAVVVQF
jgi:PIN domain nuclease of toxin-antitoxin system